MNRYRYFDKFNLQGLSQLITTQNSNYLLKQYSLENDFIPLSVFQYTNFYQEGKTNIFVLKDNHKFILTKKNPYIVTPKNFIEKFLNWYDTNLQTHTLSYYQLKNLTNIYFVNNFIIDRSTNKTLLTWGVHNKNKNPLQEIPTKTLYLIINPLIFQPEYSVLFKLVNKYILQDDYVTMNIGGIVYYDIDKNYKDLPIESIKNIQQYLENKKRSVLDSFIAEQYDICLDLQPLQESNFVNNVLETKECTFIISDNEIENLQRHIEFKEIDDMVEEITEEQDLPF